MTTKPITRRTALAEAAAAPLLPVAAMAGGNSARGRDLASGGKRSQGTVLAEIDGAGGNWTMRTSLATRDDPAVRAWP